MISAICLDEKVASILNKSSYMPMNCVLCFGIREQFQVHRMAECID